MNRKAPATLALCIATAVAMGCGDQYERGAGVYTFATTSTATAAPGAAAPGAAPLQSTDSTGTENTEAPSLTDAQRRDVAGAQRAARIFLRGYLPYSYGQAPASRIRAVDPALQRGLAARPPRVPPALARKARPRVVRMQRSGVPDGAVLLIAQIDDGDGRYTTLLELRRAGSVWRVVRVH
jgi:hypothetical protein